MGKLNKKDFNKEYTFRHSRSNAVSCSTCASSSLEDEVNKIIACTDSERSRKIRIVSEQYYTFKPESLAEERVCSKYTSKPLPEGVEVPKVPDNHVIVLRRQDRGTDGSVIHADVNCPYVIEELRQAFEERNLKDDDKPIYWRRAKVSFRDMSGTVPKEILPFTFICEMSCCNSKLDYQFDRDNYRKKNGIKPNGTEEKIFIRKEVEHEIKISNTIAEAEAFFDLSYFGANTIVAGIKRDFTKDYWFGVLESSRYLHICSNRLGSKPLSEATNPVQTDSYYHSIIRGLYRNQNNQLELWLKDSRLCDWNIKHPESIRSMEVVPEGLIPCIDTSGVFKNFERRYFPAKPSFFGIVKPVTEDLKLPKNITHYIDLRAITYSELGNGWMSGTFGKGFFGEAHSTE